MKNENRMNIFEIKYGLDYIISNTKESEDTKMFNELLIEARDFIDVFISSNIDGKSFKYKPSVIVDFLETLSDEISQTKDDPDGYSSRLFRDAAEYIDEFIM